MAYFPEPLIASRFRRPGEEIVVSANERSLLKLIWRNPGLSRSEITGHTDLTQQSVHRIIDQLVERGIVSLGSPKPGLGRGQPSPMLRLNGLHAYSAGISVNSDVVDICLVDLSGNVLGESDISLRELGMNQALDRVQERIAEMQQLNSLDDETFFGIGFGIAGALISGTKYNASMPLHEWSLIELGPLLSDLFKKPVWLLNGGSAGAVAEAMFGAGRFIKHFAYLSFNYGFGGGLINDGELLAGGNGNAGEFSGMYDDEEMVRRPALQLLLEKLKRHNVDVPSIPYLRRNFDPKWPGVAEWVEEITPAYNRLINAIWAIYDPQAIVFGGQVPPGLAQMLSERTALFGRPRYGVPRPHPKLIVSDISGDAAAMGSAIVPFKSTFY